MFLVGAAHTCPKATETASIVPGADLITALYLSPRRWHRSQVLYQPLLQTHIAIWKVGDGYCWARGDKRWWPLCIHMEISTCCILFGNMFTLTQHLILFSCVFSPKHNTVYQPSKPCLRARWFVSVSITMRILLQNMAKVCKISYKIIALSYDTVNCALLLCIKSDKKNS